MEAQAALDKQYMMIRIMTIDDSKIMRMMIQKILRDKSEAVGEAASGEEAIALYKDLQNQGQQPDVIFMDFNMEGMNGLQTSNEILKLDPNQKIILVTALNSPDLMRQAIDAGIKEFVVKPVTDEKILNAFQNVTG